MMVDIMVKRLKQYFGLCICMDQKEDGGHNAEETQAVPRVVYLHGPEG